jgi:hypothetical protein
MHMIPQVRKLEQKYAKEMVVIGVHSAKFTTERETENVRKAVLRHKIEHPVVNDKGFVIWKAYGVNAWPTFIVVDPRGKVVAIQAGEVPFDILDQFIGKVVETFDAQKLIDRAPLKLKLEKDKIPPTMLSFPGKVLADEAGGRLFISDTGNHRIIVASLNDGGVQEVIGSGAEGFADGAFDKAKLNHPQGVALDGDALYVADTENHSIRKADLKKRTVETIAGTGKQSRDYGGSGGSGKETALSSPWDVLVHNGKIYVAMAGFHQLWTMDLSSGVVRPYAGSGREALIDAELTEAALAQPSGITTDGEKLYFADSEASSVRAADLKPNGSVSTVVGPSFNSLFDFGDVDGTGSTVRLQHPVGIAHHDGVLYVADTYNHKIKRVYPKTRTATTFLGTGKPGFKDGETAQFNEPSGVSVAGGKLYIADTNNSLIRVADLKTRQVTTFELKGLEKSRTTTTAAR